MKPAEIEQLDWSKGNGLLPAIIQDVSSGAVLMTAYVNREALALMLERRLVVLYSRTRQRLWIKGESSGNYITVDQVVADCDLDAILVRARPTGSVCHTGAPTCFQNANSLKKKSHGIDFLLSLEEIVSDRVAQASPESYTARLTARGTKRIAQKIGEEAIEVALSSEGPEDELLGEAADLLFHLIILLRTRNLSLSDVAKTLELRHGEQETSHLGR
jgi:phosphoribosyl-AMP cyclohydrolase / phosphoribosyl-ATP pyrophosphohydrolase